MNVRIRSLFGLVVLLFARAVGFTSYWSVFDADGLRGQPAPTAARCSSSSAYGAA